MVEASHQFSLRTWLNQTMESDHKSESAADTSDEFVYKSDIVAARECDGDLSARCGRCEELIWSAWNYNPSGWCGKRALHRTCKCLNLSGDYFTCNSKETTQVLRRPTAKQDVEGFMDRFCCVKAAAVTILPIRARKAIAQAMDRKCNSCLLNLSDEANGLGSCNSACCPNFATDCNQTLVSLVNLYWRDTILTQEQEDELKKLVTQNGTVQDYYTDQELFDWDVNDPTTKPRRDGSGRRMRE